MPEAPERNTAAHWDERYASADRVWSGEPNRRLVEQLDGLAPGAASGATALDVGTGEGADAVWLARAGWRVTAGDVSDVGLRRAADQAPADVADVITWRHLDVFAWDLEETYDLVTAMFLVHMPPGPRAEALARLQEAVAPGGRLLVVAHDPSDLRTGVSRPPEPDLFATVDDLVARFDDGWEVETAAAQPRSQPDPAGQEVTVHDVVLRARRRSDGSPGPDPAPRSRSLQRLSIGRRPRDGILLLIAGVLLALGSLLVANPTINPVEAAIFEQVGALPTASEPVWAGLLWVGSWLAIVAAAAVALYVKRTRVGLLCAGAGAATWLVARAMDGFLANRPVPPELALDPTLRLPGPAGFGFPATPIAVVTTLVAVAAPYLSRRTAAAGWVVVVAVAVAQVHEGSLPLAMFGGAVLGWGVAHLFHLVWGTPGRRTSAEAVREALEDAGLAPVEVLALRSHLFGPRRFTIRTAGGGTLAARAVQRMHRRAGAWSRLRRSLASVEVSHPLRPSSTHHEADHEAFVTLLAERAGVRTPAQVLACDIEHGAPLLVRRHVEGVPLGALPPSRIDDALLTAIWAQLATLADARIAHHDLRAENILVDDEGRPWLLHFTFARAGAGPVGCAQDLADALVSLASLAGVEPTVSSAARSLSADRLAAALPYLRPLVLHRRVREQLDQGRALVTELRESLARRIDRPAPRIPFPVRPRAVAGLLLAGGAVYLLLPQLSSFSAVLASLRDADWRWLVAAVGCGLLAIGMSAVTLLGSTRTSLPFWRTVAVQVAAAFTGRTTPGGAGFFAINVAFLERLDIRRSLALGVVLLSLAGTSAVSVVVGLVGVFGIGASGLLEGVSIPTGWPVLVGVAAALVVLGVVLGSPLGRRRILGPMLGVARELLGALRSPVRALQLFGGAFGYLVASGLGLAASLAAFDARVPVLGVLVVFVVGQTIGHLAPTPGGLGAVEALLVAGLTALGVASTAAVAAVLASRLLTYWLPVLPGIGMFRYLQHRDVI